MRNVLGQSPLWSQHLLQTGRGTPSPTGRTEEGRRLEGTVTLSSASWASSPLEGVVGTLVMLMLR